ncbi:aminoglycoside phosphotransferase family protein [Tumebacillus sp. ITR2]|uniref:Aminoglycoside phosphotransferase family protein n=1 Tax=Tumebacillus amylolyticus TaxID=2801339 RepID=A0ABS1J4E9_9BACL|nr:aminoglycoside phosphotransferase family protein [Tumebacillus amylolyticus]MBL0385149.1 aminoglycoside phosphotransferase family protein [Tumebacillus amylolyticus]
MEDVEKWILQSVEGSTEILSMTPLKGGMSSTLHRVELLVNGEVEHVVLRQFTLREWLEVEPDLAQHEAESLRWAQEAAINTPQLIAYSESEIPAVLMTKLPGSVVLQPENLNNWLHQLAETLVQIHQVSAEGYERSYRSYNDPMKLQIPAWSEHQDLWHRAFEIARGPRPQTRECFLHRDYHPTNVLWQNGRVSGVVDWVNACRGPAGVDVGHCRLNLALLIGQEAADRFLDEYQKLAGPSFTYEPYWDLISLLEWLPNPPAVYQGWVDLGITHLTAPLMKERYEHLLASLVQRQV